MESYVKSDVRISGQVFEWKEDVQLRTPCPCCGLGGNLRPHIVWFGEMPLEMEAIYERLGQCDLFVSVGTSGNVYPAAGFVQEAKLIGAKTVELNLEKSINNSSFDVSIQGNASEIVPDFFSQLLD